MQQHSFWCKEKNDYCSTVLILPVKAYINAADDEYLELVDDNGVSVLHELTCVDSSNILPVSLSKELVGMESCIIPTVIIPWWLVV